MKSVLCERVFTQGVCALHKSGVVEGAAAPAGAKRLLHGPRVRAAGTATPHRSGCCLPARGPAGISDAHVFWKDERTRCLIRAIQFLPRGERIRHRNEMICYYWRNHEENNPIKKCQAGEILEPKV